LPDPSTSEPADIDSKSTSGPGELESKSKATETIFDHIRKKSKNFPSLVTSRGMDASHQPLILFRKFTPKQQCTADASEFFGGDSVISIDSETTEATTSPMLIDALGSPGEAARQHSNISRSPRSVVTSGHSVESNGSFYGQSDRIKISSHNLMNEAQVLGCKRAYPLESSSSHASDTRDERRCCLGTPPSHHREVSFLGFKSVFSFL